MQAGGLQRTRSMKTQPQIVYKDFSPSDALTARINEEIAELEQVSDRIISCRVAVEMPHRRHQTGNHYLIKVELWMPGKVLKVGRDPPEHDNNEDPYAAVNETFDRAKRVLREFERVSQGRTKHHERPGNPG